MLALKNTYRITSINSRTSNIFFIPKKNRHNIAFSLGVTHFWGAGINKGKTRYIRVSLLHSMIWGNMMKHQFLHIFNATFLSHSTKPLRFKSKIVNNKSSYQALFCYTLQIFFWSWLNGRFFQLLARPSQPGPGGLPVHFHKNNLVIYYLWIKLGRHTIRKIPYKCFV